MSERLDVQGVSVQVDGTGPTVVMLHGWPDTAAVWDGTVAALRDGCRCVRFTLPGFDVDAPPRSVSVAQASALIAAVVDAVSPQQPVTLLLHDWGCMFGGAYAAAHPERVRRAVVTDIGDAGSRAHTQALTRRQQAMIVGYQVPLALAWVLGRWLPGPATAITRRMARALRCPVPPERIGWQLNYPYAMQWLRALGGLRGMARLDKVFGADIPVQFCYGRRKPFMFHSEQWLARLQATPGCAVRGFDTGHWVMLDAPAEFHQAVRDWLDDERQG